MQNAHFLRIRMLPRGEQARRAGGRNFVQALFDETLCPCRSVPAL
jgi:hypothetical protein